MISSTAEEEEEEEVIHRSPANVTTSRGCQLEVWAKGVAARRLLNKSVFQSARVGDAFSCSGSARWKRNRLPLRLSHQIGHRLGFTTDGESSQLKAVEHAVQNVRGPALRQPTCRTAAQLASYALGTRVMPYFLSNHLGSSSKEEGTVGQRNKPTRGGLFRQHAAHAACIMPGSSASRT